VDVINIIRNETRIFLLLRKTENAYTLKKDVENTFNNEIDGFMSTKTERYSERYKTVIWKKRTDSTDVLCNFMLIDGTLMS
jgi:hypothetical protein